MLRYESQKVKISPEGNIKRDIKTDYSVSALRKGKITARQFTVFFCFFFFLNEMNHIRLQNCSYFHFFPLIFYSK